MVLIWCTHVMRGNISSQSRCQCVCMVYSELGMLAVFPSNNGPSWQPAGSLTSDRKQCIFISPSHTHTQTECLPVVCCHCPIWTISQGQSLHLYSLVSHLLCPPFQSSILFVLFFFLTFPLAQGFAFTSIFGQFLQLIIFPKLVVDIAKLSLIVYHFIQ